jgi:hypothetical protein
MPEGQDRPAWAPDGIDWRKPSIARVYDVHLGGAHNFAVDREVAEELARVMPELPELFRANRAFLRRAVRHLVGTGVTQFLDLGSGIPTAGNVHEIAQHANPSSRIIYVDIDPVAVAHSEHLLADNPLAEVVRADLRRPEDVLADPAVTALLDLSRPVGVLMVAALNFVSNEDDPAGIIRRYLDAVPAGSYLVISHPTHGELAPQRSRAAAELYQSSVNRLYMRDRGQIGSWFTGLELVEPGLAYINAWHPDTLDDAGDPERIPQLGGVARKP